MLRTLNGLYFICFAIQYKETAVIFIASSHLSDLLSQRYLQETLHILNNRGTAMSSSANHSLGARPKTADNRPSTVANNVEIIASGSTKEEMLANISRVNQHIPEEVGITLEPHQMMGDEQHVHKAPDDSMLASYTMEPEGDMIATLESTKKEDKLGVLSEQLIKKPDLKADEQQQAALQSLDADSVGQPDSAKLRQIDFKSSLSHTWILKQIAENFYDLADETRVDWHKRFQEDTNKIIRNSLKRMKDEFGRPVNYEYFESGSAAEQVTAVNTKYEGLKLGEWSRHIFPTEQDIMAVLNIHDLVPPEFSYRLEPVPTKPTHIKLLLFVRTPPSGPLYDSLFDSPDLDFVQEVDPRAIPNLTGYDYFYDFSEYFQQAYQEYLKGDFRNHQLSCQITKIESLAMAVSWKLTFKQFINYSKQYKAFNPAEGIHTDEAVMDLVPAVRVPEWPQSANEWLTRDRKWPTASMVQEIKSRGILMICKMRQKGVYDVMEWRLSFSEVEVKLISDRQAPCRQHAHKIFKYIIKHMASPPHVLSSYHCKMVLLWASERIAPEYWSWENLGYCVLGTFCYRIRSTWVLSKILV